MTASANPRWRNAVRYLWVCEECGERKECAVITYRGARVRICGTCFDDGWWRGRK